MYIHSYQIHNVLNEFRKQLSRKPEKHETKSSTSPTAEDRVNLSEPKQRQAIIDKVSADIIERIKNSNMQKPEKRSLSVRHEEATDQQRSESTIRNSEFSYTLIDEFNRKITSKLAVQNLKPLAGHSKITGKEMQRIPLDPNTM